MHQHYRAAHPKTLPGAPRRTCLKPWTDTGTADGDAQRRGGTITAIPDAYLEDSSNLWESARAPSRQLAGARRRRTGSGAHRPATWRSERGLPLLPDAIDTINNGCGGSWPQSTATADITASHLRACAPEASCCCTQMRDAEVPTLYAAIPPTQTWDERRLSGLRSNNLIHRRAAGHRYMLDPRRYRRQHRETATTSKTTKRR